MTYALIVGGGTAGHVLPGIAIARELVARGHSADSIHFVGSERGVDADLVPAAGFGLTTLPGRGIQRRITLENLTSARALVRAFGQARSILAERQPRVVVALGGYASVPAGVAAVLGRRPVVVAEQNAVPGLANRLIGRFAKACAVSFEGTDLPRAEWTGNPVRPEILAVAGEPGLDREAARSRLGIEPTRQLVVVFGGSLGARRMNDAVVSALPELADRGDLAIRHVIGRRDFAELEPAAHDGRLTYDAIEYEDDMATVLAAADLVICRSGATTCAELAVIGRAAVLVPLPGAPGDHQTANARALERVGGAEVIPDSIFDGPLLVATLERLLREPELVARMGEAATTIARPDAAAAVVDLVERFGGSDG